MGQDIDYALVLADLEARRAVLDGMIAGTKAILGQAGNEAPHQPITAITGNGAAPREGPSVQDVAPGQFHGLSISQAARRYLEMKKTKQKTRDICDAIRQGGIESTAGNFYANVFTTLKRRKDFVKIGKQWALAEWYPTRQIQTPEKPVKKAKRAKGAKREPKKPGKADTPQSEVPASSPSSV